MTGEGDSTRSVPIDPSLVAILCCPETRQPVSLLDAASLERLNQKIASGALQNKGGHEVNDPLDGGFIRSDHAVVYPIRDSIPIMLIEEGISTDGIL